MRLTKNQKRWVDLLIQDPRPISELMPESGTSRRSLNKTIRRIFQKHDVRNRIELACFYLVPLNSPFFPYR